MTLIQNFKNKYSRTWLSRAWHRYAPSITVSKTFRTIRVFMNLRDNIDDFSRSAKELENRENGLMDIPAYMEGDVWDVGANVGLFSVSASLAGRRCISFELSPKSQGLLAKTKAASHLGFEVVNRPLSMNAIRYWAPKTSNAENSLVFDPQGDQTSLTFSDAIAQYGVPALIKMDIEGGEIGFFESTEFKTFMKEHDTVWLVEIHQTKIGHYPKWDDVPCWSFGGNHDLYCSKPEILAELQRKLPRQDVESHG